MPISSTSWTPNPATTGSPSSGGERSTTPPLDGLLRELGVTQVVISGIATSLGVESTARSAHEHGYHVVLATDAMTDRDPAAHANSVDRVFPRLGETATTIENPRHARRLTTTNWERR